MLCLTGQATAVVEQLEYERNGEKRAKKCKYALKVFLRVVQN